VSITSELWSRLRSQRFTVMYPHNAVSDICESSLEGAFRSRHLRNQNLARDSSLHLACVSVCKPSLTIFGIRSLMPQDASFHKTQDHCLGLVSQNAGEDHRNDGHVLLRGRLNILHERCNQLIHLMSHLRRMFSSLCIKFYVFIGSNGVLVQMEWAGISGICPLRWDGPKVGLRSSPMSVSHFR